MFIDFFGFTVFFKQSSQNSHTTNPDDLKKSLKSLHLYAIEKKIECLD